MKPLNFTEKFKREDWEPLYGKWLIDLLSEPFFRIVLYKVIPTECGFVVYRLIDNGCQNEGHASYEEEYNSTNVSFTICQFIDDFISGRLKPVDESRVEDAKNIMNELKDTTEAQRKQYNDSLKSIKGRILSLL